MVKTRSAWRAAATIDDLVNSEFLNFGDNTIDLRPSFFEVVDSDIPRLGAEYRGTLDLDPDRDGPCYVTFGPPPETAQVICSPTAPARFAFACAAHREIVFDSEAGLRAYLATSKGTMTKIPTWHVIDYVARMLRAGDEEWLNCMSLLSKRAEWERKCSARAGTS